MPLILRSVKGSNLTANEVDGNFTYLSSSIDNITSGSITVTSASYAATASLAPAYLPLTGGTISGNLVVNGTGSFNYVVSTYESSSIIYSSGSTKFGDSQDDTHVFTGSVSISGSSLTLNDNAVVMSSQTSSMSVNFALTSSYVHGSNVVGTVANATSASHAGTALTANVASTASYMSGSTVVTTTITTATGSLHLAATDGAITIGLSPSSSNVIIGKVDTQTIVYGTLTNATSSLTGSLLGTSSYALEALTSSYTTNAETLDGKDSTVFATTGSNTFKGNQTISGSNAELLLTGGGSYGTINFHSFNASIFDYVGQNHLRLQANNQISNKTNNFVVLDSNDVVKVNITGSSIQLSGSVSALNGFTGSLQGNADTATTASYASNSDLLDGLDSSVFVQTGSFNSFTSSYNADSSSFSTRVTNNESTGSNLVIASGSFSTRVTDLEITSGSYSTRINVLESASGSFSIRTTDLENASGSFSTRTTNLEAFTSSYSTTGSNTFYGNQTFVGSGSGYAAYITTSVNDATLGLDSSAAINALYLLKSGTKKFEVSFDTTNPNGIFRLLPYTGSSFFEIGNPSNAGTDYVFISEPTYGNVLLGPGLGNGDGAVAGATPSIHKVQINGGMFVSGSLTAASFIGNLQGTAATASVAPYYVLTASYNSDSSSFSNRITNNESTGSTLTLASGSFSTRTTALETASGSFSTRTTALETASGSFSSRVSLTEATSSKLDTASGSFSTRVTATEATASNLNAASGSFSTRTTALETASGSFSTRVTSVESSTSTLSSASGSFSTRVSTIEGNYATTGSNTFTGTEYISNTTNATSFTSTAALYTDGGMRVTKDAYVSGTIYVNNLTVYGTQSVQYITSSQADFGTNIITVNTNTPSIRFGGYSVYDSGSTGTGRTGSLLWDSQEDRWLYTVPSGSTEGYNSAILIAGPKNTGSLGQESGLTTGKITVAVGDDHIGNSIMNQDSSTVYVTGSLVVSSNIKANSIVNDSGDLYIGPFADLILSGDSGYTKVLNNELQVTGSIKTTGEVIGAISGSNLVNGTVANTKLANSAITIAGTSTSLGGSISATTIANAIPSATITNSQLANSAISIAGSSTSLGGSISAATIGNAIGAFSGSSQVTLSSTTGYVANEHINHSSVSISAGSGLSGGGDITTTRTLTLDTGSGHFISGSRASISVSDTTGASGIDLTYSAGVLSGTLANSAVTVTAGSGLSGGGSVSLGSSVTLSNAGVTSITAGTGISRDVSTGGVTITNTGVTSNVAGTGISISGATGAVTITNSGVTSITAGTGISVNASTGGVTITNTISNTNQLTNGAGYITATSSDTLSNKSGNISQWTNNSGYQTTSGTVAKVENTVGGSSAVDLVYGNMADNDQFRIRIGGTASNAGFVEIATADDGTEPIYVRQYSGVFSTLTRTATILDGSGNTSFPGSVTAGGDVVAYSDASVKENVKTIENALDKVLALRGVTYTRIDLEDKSEKMGVIAQETKEVVPQVVYETEDGKLSVAYGNFSGLFIEAFKNQQTLIHSQQAQIDELKELVNQLLNK